MLPDTKTKPFALIAWLKTGKGAGALGVLTSVMALIFVSISEYIEFGLIRVARDKVGRYVFNMDENLICEGKLLCC